MNIFSVLGLIIGTVVLGMGLRMASPNLGLFLDYPSLFIVLGGTFAAASISFSLDRMILLFKIFLQHIMGGHQIKFQKVIGNIMSISESYRNGESLESLSGKADDHFLKEALQLLGEGILSEDQAIKVLEDRASNMDYKRREDANKIKTVGQFPPAFGMMGTTIGMIVLLANLGGEDAIKMIGPAMGVCLITTLYGVIVANLAFIPISENLLEDCKQTHLKDIIVIEGVKHLMKKSNPVIMVEELNSFLLPGDRLDWKDAVK